MKHLLSLKSAAILSAVAAAAFSLWLLALPAEDSAEGRVTRNRPAAGKHNHVEAAPPVSESAGSDAEVAAGPRTKSRVTTSRAARVVPLNHAASELPPSAGVPITEIAEASSSPVPPPSPSPSRPRRIVRKSPPVLPLAFQEDEPGAVFTAPAHAAAAAVVQDQFVEDIGGETADPSTPEYRERWPSAQRLSDLRLRAQIGAQAFARYQREALLQSRSREAQR